MMSNEEAQAMADVIRAIDDTFYWSNAVEALEARFPGPNWWSLIDADMADPRPRIPVKPLTAQEAREHREAVDRALTEYAEDMRAFLDQPIKTFFDAKP